MKYVNHTNTTKFTRSETQIFTNVYNQKREEVEMKRIDFENVLVFVIRLLTILVGWFMC